MAQLIKTARLRKGIPQMELGEKLGYSNGQFISNVERGLCILPFRQLKEVCRLLDIKPETMVKALVQEYKSEVKAEFNTNP